MSLGGSHSAAVTKDGSLYTWGYNSSGRLGDGTTTNKSVPTRISIGDNIPSLHSLTGDENGTSSISYHSISSYSASPVGEKNVTYTDLKPNMLYMFYSMKYKGDSHPLGSDNLLYLTQVRTDENGSFTLSYTPDEDYAMPTDFVVAMSQADIGDADVAIPELSYSGTEQYINPLLIYNEQRLVEGTDYRLSGAFCAAEVGEYSFTIQGIGAFSGSRTVTYTVDKKDCKTLDVDEIPMLTYDGSALTPGLTVRNGAVVLEEGTDYTVSYQNNKGVGIGIAVITGTGSYEGRQICLFDIEPCVLTEEMLLTVPNQAYTGEPLMPKELLKDLVYGTDYTAEYSDNIEAGTAEVTITGIGNYTGTLTTQFTILPKEEDRPDEKDPSQGGGTGGTTGGTSGDNSGEGSGENAGDSSSGTTDGTGGEGSGGNTGDNSGTMDGSGGSAGENSGKLPANSQKVTAITLSHTSAILYPTQCLALTASAVPSGAADGSVSFASTNPAVASVSSTGMVIAKTSGSTQIKVTAKDGSGTMAVCNITVKAAAVKLNASKAPLQVKKSSAALKVVQMEKGDKIVSWSSSKPKIVSVSSNGKLKARTKTGKSVITVQTKFGAKASCTITVQKKKVTLKSLTVSGKEQTIRKNKVTLKKGQKLTLTVGRNPITASEKISFASSAPKVASITSKGMVKAKKKGKCKITVKSSNGKKEIITINVK